MKKSTKQIIWTLIVVGIMFGGTIGFILAGAFPEEEKNKITGFIFEHELDPNLEDYYFQNGFTIIRFYYKQKCCSDIVQYLNNLPDDYDGQVIIEKITEERNTTLLKMKSLYNDIVLYNPTIKDIYNNLCTVLVVPPAECGFMNLTS